MLFIYMYIIDIIYIYIISILFKEKNKNKSLWKIIWLPSFYINKFKIHFVFCKYFAAISVVSFTLHFRSFDKDHS